jgi:phosphatidylserine decarboxylase
MDYTGSSDPYVAIKFDAKVIKTPVIKRTLHPVWNHTARILIYPEQVNYDITFEVWDWDKISNDDYVGEVTLSVQEYTSQLPTGKSYDLELLVSSNPI